MTSRQSPSFAGYHTNWCAYIFVPYRTNQHSLTPHGQGPLALSFNKRGVPVALFFYWVVHQIDIHVNPSLSDIDERKKKNTLNLQSVTVLLLVFLAQ